VSPGPHAPIDGDKACADAANATFEHSIASRCQPFFKAAMVPLLVQAFLPSAGDVLPPDMVEAHLEVLAERVADTSFQI
jgi:hypothetical protein